VAAQLDLSHRSSPDGFAYHAATVRSSGRTALPVVLACVLVLGLTACTHDGAGPGPPTSAPASGPVASNVKVRFVPGQFQYVFGNVTASFTFHGSDGTLHVLNQTADTVGPPGLYVITGDDKRYDGTVANAAPVPKAADVAFDVTFPSQVNEKTVGLLVLILGDDNMGAMAPAQQT
jgi:hypothetical protein